MAFVYDADHAFEGPSSRPRRARRGADRPVFTLARAQDQQPNRVVLDELVQINKKALADCDSLEWASARRALLDALAIAKKAGLDRHPITARTYVHLGAVYVTGFKDRQKGLQSFVRALEIQPDITLSKNLTSPDLEKVFADAAARGQSHAAEPRAADEVREQDLPAHVNALDCPAADDAPPDKSIEVHCAVAENVAVAEVFLMYRGPGRVDYTAVEMEKTPKGWYRGKIPKSAVTGKSVQLYFEGRNAAGKAVVSNGRAESPNLILIREKAAAEEAEAQAASAGTQPPDDAEENPLEERKENQGPRLYLGKVDKSKIGLDTRYGQRTWWIGLGVGSGFGYAKGNGPESRTDLQKYYQAGQGWAGLGQLAPEIGYQITPDIAVSLEGRNQWIPQPSRYSSVTAHGAQSVLARLLLFTKQQEVRFFGSLMAGGGEGFRFVLYPDTTHPDFKDTVKGGPLLAGAGGGVNYEFSKPVSLVVEVNALAGFPTFSAVADVNLALQLNIY